MNVKNIVKVMNFHALVRVDKSRRTAVKYMTMDERLLSMMDQIINNRNIQIDQKIPVPDPSKPALIFFIGSDYGFCSNYNSRINECLRRYSGSAKVIIGKKLSRTADGVLLRTDQENYPSQKKKISELLLNAVLSGEYGEIAICYNKYVNTAQIDLIYEKLYPVELPENRDKKAYQDNFLVEGDISQLWQNVLLTYLEQEIELAVISGFASENVLRQNTTHESLKKIDEREEQERLERSKARRQKEFAKIIDSNIQSMSRRRQ